MQNLIVGIISLGSERDGPLGGTDQQGEKGERTTATRVHGALWRDEGQLRAYGLGFEDRLIWQHCSWCLLQEG